MIDSTNEILFSERMVTFSAAYDLDRRQFLECKTKLLAKVLTRQDRYWERSRPSSFL